MSDYSLESWKHLVSCDSRLQRLFTLIAEDLELSIVQGFHPESEFCPSKEVTILPTIIHYPTDQLTMTLLAFISYIQGVAKGMGYKIDLSRKNNDDLGAKKLITEEDLQLTCTLLEVD